MQSLSSSTAWSTQQVSIAKDTHKNPVLKNKMKVASILKSLKANETETINKGGDNIHLFFFKRIRVQHYIDIQETGKESLIQ